MKSIQVNVPGGPENLQLVDIPTPRPGPRQALVRIVASGVNFIDIYFRTGLYKADLPIAIGSEGAGTVEAVGEGVTEVAPGDRVAYAMARGSYAEYAVVGGVHQGGVAGFERKRGVREIVSGHALQHGGGRAVEIDVCGDFHQLGGGHDGVLGVGAARHGIGYAVAGRDFGDAFAHLFHGAGAFAADGYRQVGFVQAGTKIDVDEVDAAGNAAHQRLPGTGPRCWDVDQLEIFRAAWNVDLNGFHSSVFA